MKTLVRWFASTNWYLENVFYDFLVGWWHSSRTILGDSGFFVQINVATHFSLASLSYVSTARLSHVSTASLSHVSTASLSYVSTASLSHVSTASLSYVSTASLSHISTASLSYVSTASLSHICTDSLSHACTASPYACFCSWITYLVSKSGQFPEQYSLVMWQSVLWIKIENNYILVILLI